MDLTHHHEGARIARTGNRELRRTTSCGVGNGEIDSGVGKRTGRKGRNGTGVKIVEDDVRACWNDDKNGTQDERVGKMPESVHVGALISKRQRGPSLGHPFLRPGAATRTSQG